MCWQFTHAKVQNSSRTTRFRSAASLSGSPSGVLNQGLMPTSSGAWSEADSGLAASSSAGAGEVFREREVTTVHRDRRVRSQQSCRTIDRYPARLEQAGFSANVQGLQSERRRTMTKRTTARDGLKRALLLGALGGALALVDLVLVLPAAERLDA